MSSRKALIFAAGLGTRLKPLTDTMPKALVPYKGVPLLESVIGNLKSSGFEDIVINIHHFGEQIIDFISKNDNFGINIQFSDERDLLRDTGGGVKYAESLLRSAEDDCSFLIHNVDIVSNIDLEQFYCDHTQSSAIATLVVSDRKTSRYFLFDKKMRLVGWVNISTGEVKSPFDEIASRSVDDLVNEYKILAFAGIHILSDRVFPLMQSFPDKFSIVDFYLSIAKDYPILGWQTPKDVYVKDIGKLAELEK